MQLKARVQDAFSVEMPMRVLFEHPSLRDLAAEIESLRESRFLARLADGGADMDTLIESLASMPASQVQALLRELTTEGKL
jgi:hypothetical protein